jgi:hypothetical protein
MYGKAAEAMKEGGTDQEAMKDALRATKHRQDELQAREAVVRAQGFTYNGKTGHFEKHTERGLLSLHRADDGTPALTLTNA